MSGILMFGCTLSDELLGLAEYYDAILSRKGLSEKESEFRTNKLSMILDFIRTTCVPENFKTELSEIIIESWRLKIPEITFEQREEELKKAIDSICKIRSTAAFTKGSPHPNNGITLNLKVFSALPINHLDFLSEDFSRIYDLISQIMDYCIGSKDMNLNLSHV
jgi:hypothetical protein